MSALEVAHAVGMAKTMHSIEKSDVTSCNAAMLVTLKQSTAQSVQLRKLQTLQASSKG